MNSFGVEAKVNCVILLLEAGAYLWLALWLLPRARGGGWAALGAAGAALVGVALGLLAVASAELLFLESSELFEALFLHEHSSTVFAAGRLLGVVLLVVGFVLSRRTPPAATGSIYGPG